MAGRSTLNSDAPWPGLDEAEARVLVHQRKLHRWATAEPARRFDEVFNLVCDRATLRVAWERVASNRRARTAGVDAMTRRQVQRRGTEPFLEELRSALKDGTFRPLPVRQAAIPKRGGKLRYLGIDDAEALLCFYDFPAEHWLHLMTTNPVESTFSIVRPRTRVTKSPGSKQAGLAMAFKLLEAAEDRWPSLNEPHLVALVRAGARFDKGVMVERPKLCREVAA